MKKEFRAIAMRFNEQNWSSIISKIESAGIRHNIWGGRDQCYLCNNWGGEEVPYIGNCSERHPNMQIVSQVYQEWNEAIFLEACGIGQQTFTVSKEFILEAHNVACLTWQKKIEEQFKELFPTPELEVGKWYRVPRFGKCMIMFNGDFRNSVTYGFDYDGDFSYKIGVQTADLRDFVLATDKEVETALINEVKKRGYKNGNYKCLLLPHSTHNTNEDFDYRPKDNELALGATFSNIVFSNGKWAEIMKEPIELTLEQIAERFNVNVEQIKIKK